ncbi:hypothetical protein AKAW_10742 [Aspergillus luchuensis IFO 4308]|nr:hypothetical protein AKAW_10742 [Aspergillus luchuensis IFO 4308]
MEPRRNHSLVLSVLYIVALRRDECFIRHKLPVCGTGRTAPADPHVLLAFTRPHSTMAILPHDPRVTRNWLLIELLCHCGLAALLDQGTIRRVSPFFHARARPGDVLVISAYPVTQASFQWLEATVTRAIYGAGEAFDVNLKSPDGKAEIAG